MWEIITMRRGGCLCDSQSYPLRVIRIETPSGIFSFLLFSPSLLKRNRREGREAEATGDLLDYQFDAWGDWVRKREGGERWGCAGVKGKGVKKGVMCSFPLPSAWWLQAVDFHRGLTFLHIALSLQSVWKLRPQRQESEEGWVLLWGYLCMSEGQIRNQLLINEHQFASWRTKIVPHMNIKKKWCIILTLVLHHALVELIRNSYESRNSSWRPDFTQ